MEEFDVKNRILKGAEELFLRYGVRSITMDEIARHLGMSKKTLYQYFTDKDDIVTSVTHTHLTLDRTQCEQIMRETSNAVEQMVRLSLYLKENLRGMNPAVLFDLQKYHQKAWNMWTEYKTRVIGEFMIGNMNLGIEQGFYRPDINPDILAIVRLEIIQLGFDDQLFPRDRFSLPQVQLHILEHFIYGLLTERGRKLYMKYKETFKEPLYND